MLCFTNCLHRNAKFTFFFSQNLFWVEITIDLKCKSKFPHESEDFISHAWHRSFQCDLCKMMSHSHSQTDRVSNEGRRLGSFEKGNSLSWVLISIFSDVKAKPHRNQFPYLLSVCLSSFTWCKLWEFTEQKWYCSTCPKQSSYFHFNVLAMWECCMEWNII